MSAGGNGDGLVGASLILEFTVRLDPALAQRYRGLPAEVQQVVRTACQEQLREGLVQLLAAALVDQAAQRPKIIRP